MKLSRLAKQIGITYHAAGKMYKRGARPYKTEQLTTGTIIVYPEQSIKDDKVVLDAQVSPRDQQSDLKRQLERLRNLCCSK